MTLTEIQKGRDYLSIVEQAKNQLDEVWFFGESEKLTRRLDAALRHIEIIEEELYNMICKSEKHYLTH